MHWRCFYYSSVSLMTAPDLSTPRGIDYVYLMIMGMLVLPVSLALLTIGPSLIAAPEVSLYTLLGRVLFALTVVFHLHVNIVLQCLLCLNNADINWITDQVYVSADLCIFVHTETVIGPVWVWLGGYEAPPLFAVYGGIMLVGALTIHRYVVNA